MEEYLEYWGLTQSPFLLAPDSRMMCVTGQYHECLERVKYAVKTGKGGVLIASEDAGLGKTTSLLRLIDDMKEKYGEGFRYAYVDHPTLTPSQLIAQITSEITGEQAGDDKLENLHALRETLTRAKEQGGRSIIIVDEGQLLCETPEVLQELRMLINLTHEGEYLHTLVLSGQRALWHTVKNMPELWQRLPVRFYFLPLKLGETKELIHHRLRKSGAPDGREIFSTDALEMLHRYSKGSPRTVMALADLSLLVGYTNHTAKVGFQEVLKAINAMSGQGESLPYIGDEHVPSPRRTPAAERSAGNPPWNPTDYPAAALRTTPFIEKTGSFEIPRPIFAIAIILVLLIAAGFAGYRYLWNSPAQKEVKTSAPAVAEAPKSLAPEGQEQVPATGTEVKSPDPTPAASSPASVVASAPATAPANTPQAAPVTMPAGSPAAIPAVVPSAAPANVPVHAPANVSIVPAKAPAVAPATAPGNVPAVQKAQPADAKEPAREMKDQPRPALERTAMVAAEGANVRIAPRLSAARVDLVLMGRTIKITDEKKDSFGRTWYRTKLPDGKEGWIHENVVQLK